MNNYLILDGYSFAFSFTTTDGNAGAVPADESFSLSVWCRFSSVPAAISLFSTRLNDSSSGIDIYFDYDGGSMFLNFVVEPTGGETTTATISDIPIKLREWQHFVFTIDRSDPSASSSMNVYIDGIAHASIYQQHEISSEEIGNSRTPNIDVGDNDVIVPSGSIDLDAYSIYNKALTLSEIEEIYNFGRGIKIISTIDGLIEGINFDDSSLETVMEGVVTEDGIPEWGDGGVYSLPPSEIQLYLTSLEPDMEQTNYTQSLGGYISDSLIYPKTTLSEAVALYDTEITVETADWNDWVNVEYLNIGTEILKVQGVDNNSIEVVDRATNNQLWFHAKGDVVNGIKSKTLLNDSFNDNYEQYRCYAVKNNSDELTAYNVEFYFYQTSDRIDVTLEMAIEVPTAQAFTSTTSSWSSSMLVDSSLATLYADNFFKDSYITFNDSPNSTQKSRINSYDGDTGTFVLLDSLTTDFDEDLYLPTIGYTVDSAPIQRIISGMETPDETFLAAPFTEADASDTLSLVIDGRSYLAPNEIIYIWVKRTIQKASAIFEDDNFIISVNYNRSEI